jgi:hypothetical protein
MVVYYFYFCIKHGRLAQLAEHWIPNPKAIGSTPVAVKFFLLM